MHVVAVNHLLESLDQQRASVPGIKSLSARAESFNRAHFCTGFPSLVVLQTAQFSAAMQELRATRVRLI